ncbi:MAG TPA: cytochrome P450 [Polyangiaceae bacterium]|nr:cytochrome P450 [Polyangiaceae bacterium]
MKAPELMGVGGLLHFAKDPLLAFSQAAERYGDVVEFSQLRGSYLLLNHPDAVEAMLQHKGAELRKDFFTRDLGAILGQGLLNAEGETWKRQRKLMASTFQPRELAVFADSMNACTDELAARVADGELRDVHADGMHLTLDIVVRTLFGAKLERFQEVERALAAISTEYRLLWQTWRALLPRWVPLPTHGRLKRVRANLSAILLELVQKKRAEPGRDLLSHLIALTDEEGQGMTDQQLLDESMTLFLAGHETTALAFTYTLRLLAAHPETYARLLDEVDRVLVGRAPVQSDMERLPFTSAVVREGLRLYPPVWSMARHATADVELAGVKVPANAQVIVSQWVVQRDARWFREPARFRPERWLGDECANLPRFAYFPFGGGPRVCIGQHFALLELVLVLARLSQSVTFEPSGDELELSPVITLRPKGPVRLRVRRRVHAGSNAA